MTCGVQSEPDGFASFHLYVCAAFLIRFSQDLQRERDFHVSCSDLFVSHDYGTLVKCRYQLLDMRLHSLILLYLCSFVRGLSTLHKFAFL